MIDQCPPTPLLQAPMQSISFSSRRRPNPPPRTLLPPPSSYVTTTTLLFLLAAAAASCFPSPTAAQLLDNSTDLAALLAFRSLADPGGALSASWVTPRGGNPDFCRSWKGVACSPRRPRVTQLSLSEIPLAGTIPPHIGNLSFLVSLNLTTNQLTGPLPAAALARLRRLRILDLSSNSLSGPLPAELASLPELRVLFLDGNKLSGSIPGAIFRMASLQHIWLANNDLSGEIPEDIRLPNIIRISLSDNDLEGRIPPALGRLSTLQVLYMPQNRLTGGIPPELGNLTQLQQLRFRTNNLTGTIPPALGNLTNLQVLSFEKNQITGTIPDELGKLTNLQELYLASCVLTGGFPAAVYNMSSLGVLVFSGNQLSGQLPRDFGYRLPPSLRGLYINDNRYFTGEIPSSLSNASNLVNLELSYNRFEGSIPPELGALQQLQFLSVTDNYRLSGPLDFLGPLSNCRNLQDLNLRYNRFSGTLPASAIANFTNITRFIGEKNQLVGAIPSAFGNLTKLFTLSLSDNQLSGPIPPALLARPPLQRLFLQNNQLEGPLPPNLGTATRLGLLYLHVNNMSGSVPDSIGNLTGLQKLHLAENRLGPTLPPSFWRLSALIELNLSHNEFEGTLPANMGNLSKLTQIDLSANRFYGSIPAAAIGGMQMLADLSLASNNISGPLPSTLGTLHSLETLDLSSNSLSGKIPPSLANLTELQNLNLSFNKLEGQIPEGGAFARPSAGITNESFAGNLALCGAPWFGLQACKAGRGRRKYVLPVAVAAAALCLAILLAVAALWVLRRRSRRGKDKIGSDLSSSKEDQAGPPMISYHELVMATDGFSEANLLGAGSFGKVYRGRLADGTLVAVKVLNLHMGEAAWKSFDAECRVMRSVRHRNLVGIVTTCSNLEFRALVLPFMPNGSLERWLHPTGEDRGAVHRLSLRQTVEVAADVASALEYLHHGCSEPVVHCDLKPSNVLLDANMVAHIGDFGIAKVVAEDTRSATRSCTAPGTFGYMAPEYGAAARVTTKGDVYSYGILLLEAFTGVRPTDARFTGDMNLRKWVASAFPDGAADVVDGRLLQEEELQEEEASSASGSSRTPPGAGSSYEEWRQRELRRQGCIVAVIALALSCSSESPKDRPDMVEVTASVNKIRGELRSAADGFQRAQRSH